MFGFVALTRSVKQRAQSLVQLNLELAKLESKKKATALGVAAGLALLAAVLVVYAIGFAFASAAAGISEALPLWLSLLIVAGVIAPRSDRRIPGRSLRPDGVASQARARDRGGGAHRKGASKPCLSARSTRSVEIRCERQHLNEDLTALRTEVRSLAAVVTAGLVVVALVKWRKGSREGIAAVWRLAGSSTRRAASADGPATAPAEPSQERRVTESDRRPAV